MTGSVGRIHGPGFSLAGQPERWSFSALTQAERCPAQFALSRGNYPTVWSGRGYPPRPGLAALRGLVVHSAIERIVSAMSAARVRDPVSAAAVATLRELGGISLVVDEAIDHTIGKLESNPRMRGARAILRRRLRQDVSILRTDVQRMVGSTTLIEPMTNTAAVPSEAGRHDVQRPRSLGIGNYPEQHLRHHELRIDGTADLLLIDEGSVVITDFKTGVPKPDHVDQVLVYAVLWQGDRDRNDSSPRTISLRIAYVGQVEEIEPTPEELLRAEDDLANRITLADRSLSQDPEARVGAETCRTCSVRHLCDDYWELRGESSPDFLDVDFVIVDIRSTDTFVVDLANGRSAVLHAELVEPELGAEFRALSLRLPDLDDDEQLLLQAVSASEIYRLR